jgi:parallel beta-helix repeat protein
MRVKELYFLVAALVIISVFSAFAFTITPFFMRVPSEISTQGATPEGVEEIKIGMANPASVYCKDLGNINEIRDMPDGSQVGFCIFPDSSECEEWGFLEGKCGIEHNYCSKNGMETVIMSGDECSSTFSDECAHCKNRGLVGSVVELTNLYEKSVYSEFPSSGKSGGGSTISGNLPSYWNWHDYNGFDWMTNVKDQGSCGSCWAFAAVGALEGEIKIKERNPELNTDLSEEYLVSDCSSSGDCCGGYATMTALYMKAQGIVDEECMKYKSSNCGCWPTSCQGSCKYKGSNCANTICQDRCSDWENRIVKADQVFSDGEPYQWKKRISTEGPLVATLSMNGYFDKDGIFRCNNFLINHVVTVVGYDDTDKYWIAKNSWGSIWKNGGYFKIGYGECGIGYYGMDLLYKEWTGVECGHVLINDTKLDKDLECDSKGLVLAGDGIVLDCDGHSITGNGNKTGINITGTGVKVKNCIIDNFQIGINSDKPSPSIVDNDIVNSDYGIVIESDNSILSRNNIYDNQMGLLVSSVSNKVFNNYFWDNTDNSNEDGTGNDWDSEKGNYWHDFSSNPGYPSKYIIPGPGNGVDNYPAVPCNEVITESIVMTHNIPNCDSNGLNIGADGLVLDCNGYVIEGDYAEMGYGIFLSGRDGVTIKNCNVEGFYEGISLVSSKNIDITDSNIRFNPNGIVFDQSSDGNTLTDSMACYSEIVDIKNQGQNTGTGNKCDKTEGWNDLGKEGCSMDCPMLPGYPPKPYDFSKDPCNPGSERLCSNQQGVCNGSKEICPPEGWWLGCNDTIYFEHNSSYENPEKTCDGLDNNCDGERDEPFDHDDCEPKCKSSGFVWANNGQELSCCGDDLLEDDPYELPEESCSDGNDNDCDGMTDSDDIDCAEPVYCYNCSDCNQKLIDNYFVILDNDIKDYTGFLACIFIQSERIFDCNNHIIDGVNSITGIRVEGHSNTIKNCMISEFSTGIFLSGDKLNIIKNNMISNCSGVCLHDNSGELNIIKNNTIQNCGQEGILASIGNKNETFDSNKVFNSKTGIKMGMFSDGLQLTNNMFCYSNVFDIEDESGKNTGTDNTCDTTFNWNDTGSDGCTYPCPQ